LTELIVSNNPVTANTMYYAFLQGNLVSQSLAGANNGTLAISSCSDLDAVTNKDDLDGSRFQCCCMSKSSLKGVGGFFNLETSFFDIVQVLESFCNAHNDATSIFVHGCSQSVEPTNPPTVIQPNPTGDNKDGSQTNGAATTTTESDRNPPSPAVAAASIAAGVVLLIGVIVAVVHRRRHTAKLTQERAKLATDVMGLARNKLLTKLDHLFSGPDRQNAGGRVMAVQNMAAWLEKCTVSASSVTLGAKLGDGRFGPLHCGTLNGGGAARGDAQRVVVKACGTAALAHQSRIRQDDIQLLTMFSAEAYLIGALQHDNILQVVGVVLDTIPMQMMTEHMRNGDLKSYLRACRPTSKTAKEKLFAKNLLHICSQVANACVYLEQLKVVHRGVMASNCLVGANHTQIKLSGFGSLREVMRAEEYVKTSATKETDLDIRWMATECFTDNTFSTKSDVWSLAVLLWEVMSMARKPYGNFHPPEIAAEVRSGRRLERAEGCPVELHDWMERCWSEVPSNRPTFSAMQGVIRLLLLEDADELRAKVAAATKFKPEATEQAVRWSLGMRGWEPSPVGPTDCGTLQLVEYRALKEVRLGMTTTASAASGSTMDAAALKTIFNVLIDLQHPNVVPLLGSSIIGKLVVVFHDCPFTLDAALHSHRNTSGESLPTPLSALLRSTNSKVNAVLQMALGIEYVHGRQYVHGRLSSASFYFNEGGTQLRLFLGNILHHQQQERNRQHHTQHTLPVNIRWLPYEAVGLAQDGMRRAPLAASDVYGFGVVLWELFANGVQADHANGYINVVEEAMRPHGAVAETSFSGGGGLPHSHAFRTDTALFTEIVAHRRIPVLAAPSWSTDVEQAALLSHMFTACVQHDPRDRPSIFKVASRFLDAGSNDRWEQDRRQLEFVEQLGSGQFGDVQKMATRLFSTDQSLEFVAVKTLKTSIGTNAAVLADFQQEINLMKQIRHTNLVRLLGVCTEVEPHYMILEFSAGGALSEWLPVNGPLLLEPSRATKEVYLLHPATRLMHMLHQVALGMSALERMSIVHRDLAARNVLVSFNLNVKVADFGLSRDVEVDTDYYIVQNEKPIPLKWTAPEAIKEKKYSAASDVYSFGVLCFEMFSFGKEPYTAYRAQMKFVYFLSRGTEPMHQPLMVQLGDSLAGHDVLEVPPVVETLMQGCLYREAVERLSFKQVIELTGRAARDGVPIKRGQRGVGGGGASLIEQPPSLPAQHAAYVQCVYQRVTAAVAETATTGSEMPLDGLAATPLVGLADAVAAATEHITCKDGLASELAIAMQFGRSLVEQGKSFGLSVEQVAAINLYTQESPFYKGLNGALGGYGEGGGRAAIPYYLPYIKIMLGALALLPNVSALVYRGIPTIPIAVLLKHKGVGDLLEWWSFSSSTETADVLRDPAFLGIGAEHGQRTVFTIMIKSGIRIKYFSLLGSSVGDYLQPFGSPDQNEDEVLLKPGIVFMIDAITRRANGITEVTMHEVDSFVDQLVNDSVRTAAVDTATGGDGDHEDATNVASDPVVHHSSERSASAGGITSSNTSASYVDGLLVPPLSSTGTANISTATLSEGTSESTNGESGPPFSSYITGLELGASAIADIANSTLNQATLDAEHIGEGANESTAPSSSYITGLELGASTISSNAAGIATVELQAPVEDESDETRL
jgi:serine/threonine protein kinase